MQCLSASTAVRDHAGAGARGAVGGCMSRPTIATLAGLLFVFFYIAAAIALPDLVGRVNWMLEAVYWCVAGFLWVFPIRWLMLWSVHKR